MSRRRKWLLWPAVALAAIAVVVLVLFDWNWLKGPIEEWVSAELGRDVEIAGDLDVDLSLQPRITVTDVRLANPPWASDEPMLALARAEAVVDLRALIDGEVRLPEVSITEPVLRLETRPDGPPNWEFPSEEPAGPPSVPVHRAAPDRRCRGPLSRARQRPVGRRRAGRGDRQHRRPGGRHAARRHRHGSGRAAGAAAQRAARRAARAGERALPAGARPQARRERSRRRRRAGSRRGRAGHQRRACARTR